jgi:putative transposase
MIKNALAIDVSRELIRTILKNNNFTKKKARFYGQPKDLENKIETFLIKREEFKTQNKIFVSIDEASFGRNNISTYGYALKGKKVFIRKNIPRMLTRTSICCVSDDNIVDNKILIGSVNKIIFLEFLKNLNLSSNHVILLDNVAFHHTKLVKEYCLLKKIELLYVPPYSPWFNPIELAFSIVKRHYYKCQNIENAFNSLTSQHLKSFFTKSLNTITKF